ncbi:MAG TPA: PLP-dependent aspartate aminotransferase family protein [Chthoniobacterales bacterium]|jgi:cystathionine beta-lyase/cystathionine gamma-synthase|nr:PLP-dependent aspartate aminotransferase family protein [Chthoniobacterales bacterium]
MKAQTLLIHPPRGATATRAVTSPIWQSTSFEADSIAAFAEISQTVQPPEYYTRYGNPGHQQVEALLAELEGGEAALMTASGMAAIFTAVVSGLKQGDHVLAQRNVYASAATLFQKILPRWGIECSQLPQTVDFTEGLRPNTKLIYVETPANPVMGLTDLRAVARVAKERGITTMADNTFATPINQRPLGLGIDVVVHSATKYLSGHHDVMAGAIVGPREFIDRAWHFHLVAGGVLSPFDSWLLLRGLRTLELRVQRHNRNALALARYLKTHPAVARVNYPFLESHPQHALARAQMSGGTGMLSLELHGGREAAERFVSATRLGRYAASLGGFTTLLVHPAAMWAESLTGEQRAAMDVSDSLVRISTGLEDEEDLLADFAQALDSIT